MTAPFIPPKTVDKLNGSHPEGHRHQAKIEIALPLIGNGIPPEAVAVTLREKFPAASEKEIEGVVRWCVDKNPTPSGYGDKAPLRSTWDRPPKKEAPKLTPTEAVADFLNGSKAKPETPVAIETAETVQLFKALYLPTDYISIVCRFTTNAKGKANPDGPGATKSRDAWIEAFETDGIPHSDAGAWMRPNPMNPKGSGKGGAPMDADTTDFRFLLIEFDHTGKPEQQAIYRKLGLPIAAIIDSGGKSVHAWIRMDSADATEYGTHAKRIYDAMAAFDLDGGNKNPSRLSRLVGAPRKIQAQGDGMQRLLYLDPEAKGVTLAQIESLEKRVQPVRFKFKPMLQAVNEAIDVYEDISANKHKTGFRTGFERFDLITGGLKKSWLTVIAGETGAGKTTYVLNIVMNALERGEGVALFSFEMDQQEIIDMIFSRQATIDRNTFNNGCFTETDFKSMDRVVQKVSQYPLFTFDDPNMGVDDVAEACARLHAEHPLSLIVIDYIQLANVDAYQNNREQQVALVSRKSKGLAKMLKVPVIAVSQLNEDGKVRESRGIAHDANAIIKVCEDDKGNIEARVIKGRSIPKGVYYYSFKPALCRFDETGCEDKLKRLLPAGYNQHEEKP